MKIDKPAVDKLADLAKLEFTDESKTEIIQDLNKILAFVEKLEELDTNNIEPLIYMTEEANVLRTDAVKNDLTKEEALKNAPVCDSDYFIVPKVLDKK